MDYAILVLAVVVAVVVFIVLREFFAWYAKTNEIIKLLKEQVNLLKEILNKEKLS